MYFYNNWQVLNINFVSDVPNMAGGCNMVTALSAGFISMRQTTLSCKKHEPHFSMNLLRNATKQFKLSAVCISIQLPFRASYLRALPLPLTDFDRRDMQSPLWHCASFRCLIAKIAATGEHVHVLHAYEGNFVQLNIWWILHIDWKCLHFDILYMRDRRIKCCRT